MFGKNAKKRHLRSIGATISYFARNIFTVVGLVLIWRGVWLVIDFFDEVFFDNNHLPLAIGGIVLGLAILYLPDQDLKEIEKL